MKKNSRHVELEKRSQYFAKQGKTIFRESPKEHDELNDFRIVLFHEILWRHRKESALIMEKFVNDSIDMEQFQIEFSLFYWKTDEAYETVENDLKKLERLQFDPRSSECEFSRFIVSIFRQFEVLEDEECSEQDVRDLVKNNLLLMQPYLEFADEIDISVFNKLKLEHLKECEIESLELDKPGKVSTDNRVLIAPMLFFSLVSCFVYYGLKPGFLNFFWNIIH
jgi:hypothetical protein